MSFFPLHFTHKIWNTLKTIFPFLWTGPPLADFPWQDTFSTMWFNAGCDKAKGNDVKMCAADETVDKHRLNGSSSVCVKSSILCSKRMKNAFEKFVIHWRSGNKRSKDEKNPCHVFMRLISCRCWRDKKEVHSCSDGCETGIFSLVSIRTFLQYKHRLS